MEHCDPQTTSSDTPLSVPLQVLLDLHNLHFKGVGFVTVHHQVYDNPASPQVNKKYGIMQNK